VLTAEASAPNEERKIVTVLFCDLVGFTSRSERLDPEQVRALLAPYHARLRAELERFGGTVEKFIGDAVVAFFGAPVAHEDDAERAVRAALAIRDWITSEEEDLQVRIAVNTGEALVSIGARPSAGEAMVAGDVVNTAARMQAAAPVNGILVGERTYELTGRAIEHRAAAPIVAKGKRAPVSVWEVVGASARSPDDVGDGPRVPLAGRRREIELLGAMLARAHDERLPQLMTLVGVPGVGKTRLVAEFLDDAERARGVRWLRGRCLPYGDGVTFWALSDMVKAQAGILESDSAEQAAQKLARAVRSLVAEDDADWVEAQLRPLIGVGAARQGSDTVPGEAFAAWRRFLEAIAEQRTTIAVFEDLHWADDGLLDFIDLLVEWVSGVPLLVVCTARPELLTRRSDWGGGKPNASNLVLSPLSDAETALLVDGILAEAPIPPETRRTIVARANGNPLYAGEFARLVVDQGVEAIERLPDTVQGIIAARLDGLPAPEKALVKDAAVAGQDFWLGVVCAISNTQRDGAEQHLHALQRKQFVRRLPRTSVEHELEFAFAHILVRDVAYSQIPRAERAAKHRLAAGWIESLGRPDDHAEVLADHYVTALELERAAGVEDPTLVERAQHALRDAGARSLSLGTYARAAAFYDSALRLCPSEDPGLPLLLLRRGEALRLADGSGLESMEQAFAAFQAAGDIEGAAEAATSCARTLWYRGARDEAYWYVNEAVTLVAARPPSPAKAKALLVRSGFYLAAGEFWDALRFAREALPVVEELGLVALRARALNLIGSSRIGVGDADGLADMEEAVETARSVNAYDQLDSSLENLRAGQLALGQLSDAAATVRAHAESPERFGNEERRGVVQLRAADAYRRGSWDDALAGIDEFLDEVEAGSPHYLATPGYTLRCSIRLARGDLPGAGTDVERALGVARRAKDVPVYLHALCAGAVVALADDRLNKAAGLASEMQRLGPALFVFYNKGWPTLVDVAWVLHDLDRVADLLQLLDGIALATPWVEAARAIAKGDGQRAAEVLAQMGDRSSEAYARLRAGRALLQNGRGGEAEAELVAALTFYRGVGAVRYAGRAEELLASPTTRGETT
jgi:class 3 adenylate cyclase/tetratricopeptide (TPR) repeat protein